MLQSTTKRPADGTPTDGVSLFVTAHDGLRLHVRAYGARASSALPVVCLPGLARTAADFETLALTLSSDRERLVLALDYRGRGKSQYDRKLPQPASFRDAADILQRLFGSHFPKWSDADWLGFARRTFKAADGRLVADYD